jgi:hypothetical protein
MLLTNHNNNMCVDVIKSIGDVAQMVERSLCMREARGSIPRISILFLPFFFLQRPCKKIRTPPSQVVGSAPSNEGSKLRTSIRSSRISRHPSIYTLASYGLFRFTSLSHCQSTCAAAYHPTKIEQVVTRCQHCRSPCALTCTSQALKPSPPIGPSVLTSITTNLFFPLTSYKDDLLERSHSNSAL